MPYIIYSCVTAEGAVAWRSGTYDHLGLLYDELAKRGEHLDKFYELPGVAEQLLHALRGRLRIPQVVELCSYLALYIQGGLDLQTALADLSRGSRNGLMRHTADTLRKSLVGGLSLSEAMRRTEQFPDVVVSMAQLGEVSGSLDRMLKDAADYLSRIEEIKSATKRAMLYPAFSLFVLIGTGIFWMTVVVPKLAAVYKTMGIELPAATRAMIALSDFFSSEWLWVVLGLFTVPVVFSMARKQRDFRVAVDRVLWEFPVIGPVVRNAQEAFYFQYLALVYGAGVPITEAVGRLVETVHNRYFRARIKRIPEFLRLGLSLREAFQRTAIFQPLDIRMIAIGEQTGALEEQLRKLATMYMQRVQASVELLTKAIEPLLVLLMGAFFIFFVVAMMGPIYSILSNMLANLGGAQ
ncbi:type II secretion system F family protein [Oryzomicrobium sp.]|uniref:type II secretion system F family protein n=1 Tax=Oryzomicrobium sp. TaxID=1911578 RepID=UPI0025EFA9B5|nr:type II secretion system F family protein [Oryzomicrobium sp.]MCE1241659.1 type II secretion system F family protein [Oryzomicrobium sp.]